MAAKRRRHGLSVRTSANLCCFRKVVGVVLRTMLLELSFARIPKRASELRRQSPPGI